MRIATSTIYDQQTMQIDNLVVQQQQYAQELSSGKALTEPSDDPVHVAEDLDLSDQIALGNDTVQNLSGVTSQLNAADGALNTLTDIVQSARSLAIQGASDDVSDAQRTSLGAQVDQLLDEAIGVANTQYNGTYLFAGTASPTTPPVTANGSPPSSVSFTGNLQAQTQTFPNGQTVQSSVTLQQAFNYDSTDGSPDLFQTLISLRDTLDGGPVVDESSASLNVAGTVIDPATDTLNSANLVTPVTADSSGQVSIELSSMQDTNGTVLTFDPATDTIQDVIAAINGSGTGVTASWDAQRQRLVLSASGSYQIQDVSSPGASDTGNFVEAFGLQSQADTVNALSEQLGDVDNVLQSVLDARTQIGSTIQDIQTLSSSESLQVNSNTQVQSGIEDADIAKVMTQFTQTQTALQAAYGTTSRLEQNTLFDYLS